MKKVLACVALLAAVGAHAESQYGYGTAANVTAQARLSLQVNVPKLILLRIGSAGATQDSVNWTLGASIPATPTTAATGNNQAVNWDNNAPTFSVTGTGTTVAVSAFTNTSGSTISCAAPTWSGTPTFTNAVFTVTTNSGLTHPGANLGACAAATTTAIPAGSIQSASWTYNINATSAALAGWTPGSFTATLAYTATAP